MSSGLVILGGLEECLFQMSKYCHMTCHMTSVSRFVVEFALQLVSNNPDFQKNVTYTSILGAF